MQVSKENLLVFKENNGFSKEYEILKCKTTIANLPYQ